MSFKFLFFVVLTVATILALVVARKASHGGRRSGQFIRSRGIGATGNDSCAPIKSGDQLLCGEFNSKGRRWLGKSARVYHGGPALPGELPHQARLVILGIFPLCGGVIIGERHILTAAHCIASCGDSNKRDELYTAALVKIHLGDHYQFFKPDCQQVHDIESIKIHEKYVGHCKKGWCHHDIAIIKTKRKIDFKLTKSGYGSVNRACSPPDKISSYGGKAILSGWGNNGRASNFVGPNELQVAKIPVVSRSRCEQAYNKPEIENCICAGESRGNSYAASGKGDSGGPLVRIVGGRYELIGIVSMGQHWPNGSPANVAAYVEVSRYLSWIKSNMR